MSYRYKYEVSGTAAEEQTWKVEGVIEIGAHAYFIRLPDLVMREAFNGLTEGKAEHGRPGVGCDGPYIITRMLIEEVVERGGR